MRNLIRLDLQEFKAYSSARDEATNGLIWLNANESPFSNELDNQLLLNRYPEKQPKLLQRELATLYGVKQNQLVISRGSDEVIDLLVRLFCESGKDAIMICPPTFGMYAVCAKLQGANVIEVPLLKSTNYQFNISSILGNWQANIKILFLCSPNNPTGNTLPIADVLKLCEAFKDQSIVVVDEAYIEFSEQESFAKYIDTYPNLVVLRTLSKAYALAGARCGILLAQNELVSWLLKIMPPYPLPSYITSLILKTLSFKDKIQQQIEIIKSERKRMFDALSSLSCVKKVWQSEANFLLVETFDAAEIMKHCADQGVILRNFDGKAELDQCVRISIGLPEENDKLISVLLRHSRKRADCLCIFGSG